MEIIRQLFDAFEAIRYVAIYTGGDLVFQQREAELKGASSAESDQYEELLVNPTLLTLTTQRGNLDCGGLSHLIIGYGNFYQIVKSIRGGHLSISIDKASDLNKLPQRIFDFYDQEVTDAG